MNLKEQGFRFLISEDRKDYDWVHPSEIPGSKRADWVDCTEMTNAEFDTFMGVSVATGLPT